VERLARIIFPHYWEVLSLAGAVGEWTLWCWAWGAPASPIAHVVALAVLFGVNRLAAVGHTAFGPLPSPSRPGEVRR